MELTFAHVVSFGSGHSPAVVHLPTNDIALLTSEAGALTGRTWSPGPGDVPWDAPDFQTAVQIADDMAVTNLVNGHLRGGANWVSWTSGTRDRVALLPESPKIMKRRFFDGLVSGIAYKNYVKGGDTVDNPIPQPPSEEDWRSIDYWNGFSAGLVL